MRARALTAVCVALLLATSVSAQEVDPKKDGPVLTDVQKLQVLNAAKDAKILEQQIDLLARDLEKAREALRMIVAAVTPPGYKLGDDLKPVKLPDPSTEKDKTP